MRRCNPRQVFPINTCDRHKTSNNEQTQVINTSRFLPPPLLRHQVYFIPIAGVHMQLGEQVFEIVVLSDPAPGEDK
jgi:hypothetical protein